MLITPVNKTLPARTYRSVRTGRVNSSLPVRRACAAARQAGRTQTGVGVKALAFYLLSQTICII